MNKDAEPVLVINPDNPVPVYRQIVDGLRALFVAETFKPGDKLPTVRQLATDLAVNHNTVAAAYRLLAEEGWLELKRRNGAVVINRSPPAPVRGRQTDFARRLRELAAIAIADGAASREIAGHLRDLARKLTERQTP